MRFGFDRKFLLAAAVALSGMVLLVAASIQIPGRMRDFADELERVRELQTLTQAVTHTLVDLESDQHGYLTAPQAQQLEHVLDDRRRMRKQMAALSSHLATMPPDELELHRLAALMTEKQGQMAQGLDAETSDTPAQKLGQASRADKPGKPWIEEVSGLLTRLDEEASRALARVRDQATEGTGRTIAVALLLAAAMAALLAWLHLAMVQERELRDRIARAEHVAKEALERTVQERTAQLAEATAALRLGEERLRCIFESATDAILTTDESQRILMANPAAAEVFRSTVAGLLGLQLEELIPPGQRAAHRLHVQQFGAARGGSRRMSGRRELSALRRDGECFPIDASISQARINGQQLYTVILRDVTEIKAAQTELQASHAELQLLFESRLNVQEEERRRIARELHDDLQQSLAAIRMDAAALADQLPAKASGPAPALLRRLDRLAADAIVSTRRIVNDLRPEMLEDLGLAPALGLLARQFQERAHIRCDVDATEEVGERLSGSPIALVGYFRIAQEALTNVAKHSGATQVQIDLFLDEDGAAVIRIHDNGCGMRTGDRRKAQAFGLVGMRERARAMGGVLRINSQPGAGTTIELRVKLPPTDLRPVCS